MLKLKLGWQKLSTSSRIAILVVFLSVIAFSGLLIFLPIKSESKPRISSSTQANPPTSLPGSTDFNYAAKSDTTPAPIAKNEASLLLARANRYLMDGEAVQATTQYQYIITNYPNSPETVEASFGLAQASVAQERWQEAADLYKNYLAKYPNDSRHHLALFALADIQKAQGYWEEAINYYQQYLQDKNGILLEGYAFFGIAEGLDNSLKKEEALEYYKKAGNSPNASNLLRVTALERVGDYYVATNNPSTATGWYNQILALAKVPDYRATILLKMAKTYAAVKQFDQANTTYNIIVDQYLETPAGLTALRALNTANPNATSDFHRGYLAYQNNDWSGAISAFGKVLGRTDENAEPNTNPALPSDLSKPQQEKLARTWFWLGRAYELKGNPGRAANEFRELQIRLPETEAAQEAIWRVALILRNAGQTEAAIAQFGYITSAYPAGHYTEQAFYNQSNLVLTNHGPEAALPVVNTFADKFLTGELRNQTLYDLYRAFEAKGNKDTARLILQKAAISTSSDYYAMRAADIIAGQNPLKIAPSNAQSHAAVYEAARFAKDAEQDRKTMESWLLTWVGQPPTGVTTNTNALETAQKNIRNDDGLKRLADLRMIGRKAETKREAIESLDRYDGKPAELYLLALYLNEQNQYFYSISAAQDLLSLYQVQRPGAGLRATPLMLQKLIYPLDYQNLVLEQARIRELDPLLFLALIKQESAFRSDALSGAGARGLTQVMPETGRGIAQSLGKTDYSPNDLYQPAIALAFGAYYLANRLQDFDGNPYAALAAYNGGAGNVYRWIKIAPPELSFDTFVEGIDFYETRNYVKIIYANYAIYRQIYATPPPQEQG
ncbi:MAG: transglycosylase SLT domain-containing protein [Chloroflexota bacterium]